MECPKCSDELINLNGNTFCVSCQEFTNPACPVCGQSYIRKAYGNHYYHHVSKLLGIPHWDEFCVNPAEEAIH
jgi:hypothetical protein